MRAPMTIRAVPGQWIHAVREQVPAKALPAFMGEAFGELYGHLGALNVEPMGGPLAVYHAVAPDSVDAEVAVPVATDVPAGGRAVTHRLEPVTVAVTLHRGPYEEIAQTYAALAAWVAASGRAVVGPVRERYLVGGEDVTPAEYVTQIEMPVSEAAAPVPS